MKKCLLFFVACLAQAATIEVVDPYFRSPQDNVVGPHIDFAIQELIVVDDPPMSFTLYTNYPTQITGIPIPTVTFDGSNLQIGDILLQDDHNFYAVVLAGHDGYAAGDLYRVPGFTDSTVGRVGTPVLAMPGGTLLADGTITAGPNGQCDGTGCAAFAVNVQFSATVPDILNNDDGFGYVVQVASASCGNGELGQSVYGGPTPEPATRLQIGSGLVLGGFLFLARRVRARP